MRGDCGSINLAKILHLDILGLADRHFPNLLTVFLRLDRRIVLNFVRWRLDGPVKPDHDSGGGAHQSPGRVAAPGFVKQRPAVMARGCGAVLGDACAFSSLKFLRRPFRAAPRRGSGLLRAAPGLECFYPMRPTFRTLRQAALAWAIGSTADVTPVCCGTLHPAPQVHAGLAPLLSRNRRSISRTQRAGISFFAPLGLLSAGMLSAVSYRGTINPIEGTQIGNSR